MLSLDKALKEKKESLSEFSELTIRILNYLPNVVTSSKDKGEYTIHSSQMAGTLKYIRPINKKLFIYDSGIFIKLLDNLYLIFDKLKRKEKHWQGSEKELINRVLYTIQQSIGAGFDLLVDQNSARKHVGNRFEELIRAVFSEIGIANDKGVLQIPYPTEEGNKIYKCENDIILSPYKVVKSRTSFLDEKEVVVSVKTSSKDRMGKIFIDKLLLERFVKHKQKVIGIFLNDVQRKESDNISFTLVSGLFMVYTKFLTNLDGIYYLDLPPKALKSPYNQYIKPFSELITSDLFNLLTP